MRSPPWVSKDPRAQQGVWAEGTRAPATIATSVEIKVAFATDFIDFK